MDSIFSARINVGRTVCERIYPGTKGRDQRGSRHLAVTHLCSVRREPLHPYIQAKWQKIVSPQQLDLREERAKP